CSFIRVEFHYYLIMQVFSKRSKTMNILVTSAGRRVKVVEYLKESLKDVKGQVIATDGDVNAPAIHFADAYEIVPRIDDGNYIKHIIQLCEKYNITGIVSLIDP